MKDNKCFYYMIIYFRILFGYMVVVNSLNLKNHSGRGKAYENSFKLDCDGHSIDYNVCETEECENLGKFITVDNQ